MTRVKLLTLAFATLFSIVSFGQELLSPGYIIKTNGDTLFGNMGEFLLRDSLKLKFEKNENNIFFSPSEINSFKYSSGELYESIQVGPTRKYKFLQVLIRGEVTLYFRVDDLQTEHYYLQFNEEGPQELVQEEKIVWEGPMNSQRMKGYNKQYFRILSAAFIACPDMFDKLDQYDYNLKDFIKAVTDYHNCIGKQFEVYFSYEKKKARTDFGVLLGAKSVFYTSKFEGANGKVVKKYPGINAGFHSEFFLSKTQENISLQVELLISQIKYDVERNHQIINQTSRYIHVPLFANYYYRLESSGILFGAGMDLGEGFGFQTGYEQKINDNSIIKLQLRALLMANDLQKFFLNLIYAF
ncbi:MAG: hypothetical protein K9G76_02905 [Bacteroidales bacterium]|nr:hypothetical protein [Bacteroidales bacterium]MCF8402743.1 hypothetical protein [Bacteroidales bacterium]